MARRWGLGPVFVWEWLLMSRRWQLYAGRAGFIGFLLGALFLVWQAETAERPNMVRRAEANVGENFFYAIVGTQLALVLLAAPGATAGAICLDKARGALAHLFVTDLSDSEIILGKLAARLLPVLGLIACGAPVLFLALLLGGIDPEALIASLLITLGVAVAGCALALTLSVWGSRAHEILLATYIIWVGVLLAAPSWWLLGRVFSLGPVPHSLRCANPFWLAFAPYGDPGATAWTEPLVFLGVCLGLAAVLLGISIARVRAVALRQAGRPPRARFRLPAALPRRWWRLGLQGPSLDRNPVLWREWQRRRPSRWIRIIWGLYILGAVGFSALAAGLRLGGVGGREMTSIVNAFQVSVGLLLLSISAVTALGEERAHGNLDVLLTTPLSTASIVWGKWWGTFRTVPWLAALPGLNTLVVALTDARGGPGALRGGGVYWPGVLLVPGLALAYGTAITSFGLALATWISRPGRAIAVSVSAYVLVTVGWVFVIFALGGRTVGDSTLALVEASPFYGIGVTTAAVEHAFGERATIFAGAAIWIVAYLMAAVVLQAATLMTFNRCLGRVSPGRPRTTPRKR
jgi:ABC-type transport system involved in multi-copper enzyme maturation permease subunit